MPSPIVSLATGMMVARAAGVSTPAGQIRAALPAYLIPTPVGLATTVVLARQQVDPAPTGGGGPAQPPATPELVQLPRVVGRPFDDARKELPDGYFRVVRQEVVVFDDGKLGKVLEQAPEPGLVPIGQLVTLRVGVQGDGPTGDRLDQIEEQQREMQGQLGTVQRTLDTVLEQLKKLLEDSSGGPKSGSAKS